MQSVKLDKPLFALLSADTDAMMIFLSLLFAADDNGNVQISISALARELKIERSKFLRTLASLEQKGLCEHIVSNKANNKVSNVIIYNIESYKQICTTKQTINQIINAAEQTPIRDFKERYDEFCDSVMVYGNKYSEAMLSDFIGYWTEDIGNGQMKFEKEKTWKVGGRLSTWKRNEKKDSPRREDNLRTINQISVSVPYGAFLHYIKDNYPNVVGRLPLPTEDEFNTINQYYRPYIKEVFALLDGNKEFARYDNFITAFTKALNQHKYATKDTRSAVDDRLQQLASGVAATIAARDYSPLPNDLI